MSEKSFVTMEAAVCPVCGKQHDTGNLLLDQRMRNRFDRQTVTGWQMCEEHQKLKDAGYIALVAIDESKSDRERTLSGVWRTGAVAHVRASAWPKMFNVPMPAQGLCFVDEDVIKLLSEQMPADKNQTPKGDD